MNLTKSDTLRVPGANLYYEVRGSGPLLLMISAGDGGGEGFNNIANQLADDYTVVTYDRRGFASSSLDDPTQEISLEMQSDDAHQLLSQLTTAPAYVFGSSAGALIGLELVARHPEQVDTLVAHEPPAHYLLPDTEQPTEDPLEAYYRLGAEAALQQFIAQVGVNYNNREVGVELPQRNGNVEALFIHTMQAVRRYRLDLAALLSAPTRIIIAGGSAGREFVTYHCAIAVAEQLRTTVVEFPGHHAGYVNQPKAFAERLHEVLGERSGTNQ